MKFRIIIIFLLSFSCLSVYSQNKQTDFPFFSKENLEFTALKPFFYLIRQEYVVTDESGKPKIRGGNDFYGKAYTIGVLAEDTRIWFPTYVRFPWEIDNTFDRKINKSYKPECSLIYIKKIADQDFFRTKLKNIDERNLLTAMMATGEHGITIEKSPRNNGTLVLFYTSAASPDDFTLISHSITFLEEITWNQDGISEIEELNYGNNKIIGGVLFSRDLIPGAIYWKLSGFYLPVGDKWVLASMIKP